MEEKIKNKYLIGTVGAMVGALIGAIPWVLLYVLGNMMYAFLAIIIVVCSFYGYKLTKAKIDKKLPIILSITSFISITVTMFLIIPVCYMAKELGQVNFEYLQAIYNNSEFLGAITTDYIISLLFCLATIGILIYNLNQQLKKGVENIKILSRDISNNQFSNEDIKKVKEAFEKNNATNRKQTITKELIMEDLIKIFGEEKAEQIFNYLKIQEIIKKKSNKYYFSEKAQESIWYRYGIANLRTFLIVLVIAVILAFIIVYSEQNTANDAANELLQEIASNEPGGVFELGVDDLKIELPDNMVVLTEDQIARGFGEEYKNAYDLFATSTDFNQTLMVFKDSKSNYEKEYKPEEYLKAVLQDDTLEIEELKIKDNIFYYVERPYNTNDDLKGIVIDGIFITEDEYICILIDTPQDNQLDIENLIK